MIHIGKAIQTAAMLLAAIVPFQADAKEWDTVRIATEGAYAPWNFTKASGELDGFDVDVAHALCERMKAKCTIVAQDWDGIIPALNAGKYDAIIAAMAPTEERRKIVNFSTQYALGPRSFVTLKDSPLASVPAADKVFDLKKSPEETQKAIDDLKPLLKGKTIGIQGSTTHAVFMDKYLKGIAEIREYKTTDQILLDLNSGRIDATFDDAAYLSGQRGTDAGHDLVFFGPRFDGGLLGDGSAIALRKVDADLRDKFDTAIKGLVADGTLSKISMKWFKIDIAPKQ